MFALWPGDRLNFNIFIKPTFGFVGQRAASEAGHIANTDHWQQLGWTMTTTQNKIIIIALSLCIISCDNKESKHNLRTNEITTDQKTDLKTPEDFDEFLTRFNNDTLFKISRIIFPIEQDIKDPIEGNDGIMIYDSTNSWVKRINLEYLPKYHDNKELEFIQDTMRTMDFMVIKQKGGYLDTNSTWDREFQFGLIDNKWYLIRLKDYSDIQ